jgi:hypothetical protein
MQRAERPHSSIIEVRNERTLCHRMMSFEPWEIDRIHDNTMMRKKALQAGQIAPLVERGPLCGTCRI